MRCGLDISGGLGVVCAPQLGHWWWCRIGECTVPRTLMVVGLVSALQLGHGWWNRIVG